MNVSPLVSDDLPEVLELWSRTAGVGLNESDTPAALGRFLARNPALSRVVRDGDNRDRIVAAVLCGHDGRRGFLYHLAVVYRHNADGKQFWQQIGFESRDDLDLWQRATHQ